MPEIKITDVRTVKSSSLDRMDKEDAVILYTAAPGRSYQLVMPKEDATPDKVKARIMADEAERQKLLSLKITL